MSDHVRFNCIPGIFCFKTKTKNLKIHIPETPEIKKIPIPFDIQKEIMKRLPVKSLLRFMCVSKAWKSLIHDSKFIAAHHLHQPHRLLLLLPSGRFCSIPDTEVMRPFPRSIPAPLPMSINLLESSSIVLVGSSHGLFCFSGITNASQLSNAHSIERVNMAVIWNPSIRKSVPVAVPYPKKSLTAHEAVIGFGVCPFTSDPKIVAITQFVMSPNKIDRNYVDVCTLNSGKWRSLSSNLPSKSMRIISPQVVVGVCIYWMCLDGHNLIMSFDMTNDSFKVVVLPDRLAHKQHHPRFEEMSLFKVRESLAVIEYNIMTGYVVWMMKHEGVQIHFTQAFSFKKAPYCSSILMGFRKSGSPIMEIDYVLHCEVDRLRRHLSDLKFPRICNMFVNSYVETLLLLGGYGSSSSLCTNSAQITL